MHQMHSPALPCSKNVKHGRLENDLNWTKSNTHTLGHSVGSLVVAVVQENDTTSMGISINKVHNGLIKYGTRLVDRTYTFRRCVHEYVCVYNGWCILMQFAQLLHFVSVSSCRLRAALHHLALTRYLAMRFS